MTDELNRPDPLKGRSEARAEEREGLFVRAPSIELPGGGGAISGIGEAFSVHALTGTASLQIPIAAPPGRQGFGPTPSLSYDSGGGQGAFGIGWRLDAPRIQRKTDRRLPTYSRDDVFTLGGVELVPHPDALPDEEIDGRTWQRTRYWRREEGSFDWIERRRSDGEVFWRVRSGDNVLRTYGATRGARTSDPEDPKRIFAWHLEEERDELGNVVHYSYKTEDGVGVRPSDPAEVHRHRHGGSTWTFLKRVRYGNRTQGLPDPVAAADSEWCFELVFDYGEHDETLVEVRPWPLRPDPFSRYRAGFDMRCRRLCRRVLAFHRFEALGADPVLVRSTELTYDERRDVTTLVSVRHVGHKEGERAALPAVRLTYQEPVAEASWAPIRGVPGDHERWQWVDLDGEGLPGLLTEQAGSWFYAANDGEGRLLPPRRLSERPAVAMADGASLVDLDGDGRLELLAMGALPGFSKRTETGWDRWQAFRQLPAVDPADPNVRLLDLTGDGRPDLVLTETEALSWWPSRGAEGYGPVQRHSRPADERDGPTLVFVGDRESVYLADMSGDGLTDLVRVRNSSVCYWPNLGHGRFGAQIVLGGVEPFDGPDQFDPGRIKLLDIDGSGPADLAYVGRGRVRWWKNLAGNALSEPTEVRVPVHDGAQVQVADVYGEGLTTLVWRSTAASDARAPMRALRLLSEGKPWLLGRIDNGLGRSTTLDYTPSTQLYLADRRAGSPWVTRLPFPVHCLTSVSLTDAISGWNHRSVSHYRHGYYDGVEREFRGFGRVETREDESVAMAGAERHQAPPVRTVSWFHTGAWEREHALLSRFDEEYWQGPIPAVDSPVIAENSSRSGSGRSLRDAHRALRGQLLRQEVYSDDGSAVADVPYSVNANEPVVRVLHVPEDGPCVTHLVPGRGLAVTVDRAPADPRVAWTVPIEVDAYGQVRVGASVAEPRRVPEIEEQGVRHVQISELDLVHVDGDSIRHLSVIVAERAHELAGYGGPPEAEALRAELARRTPVDFHETADTSSLRSLSEKRLRYWADDLSGPLPDGQVGARRLLYDTRVVAFSDAHLADGLAPYTADPAEGGYVRHGDTWWVYSGRTDAFGPFFLPTVLLDAFDTATEVTYDPDHLVPVSVENTLGHEIRATLDWHALAPAQVVDANGHLSEAAYDPLGRLQRTAVRSRDGVGDTLAEPTTEIRYFSTRFEDDGRPAAVQTLARETHGDPTTRWMETWTHTDGGAEVVVAKLRAEEAADGQPQWLGSGRVIRDNRGQPLKQYEPFFSATSEFEGEEGFEGVSSLLTYDPIGRVVRVDRPDGTFVEAKLGSWSEETWDATDTVLESRWYQERTSLPETDERRKASEACAVHAETPARVQLDPLGRPVRSLVDAGSDATGAAVLHETRVRLDLQGNVEEIVDARGVTVLRARSDRLGRALFAHSPDAGDTWTLVAVDDQTVRTWRSGELSIVTSYDELRRPTRTTVTEGTDTAVVSVTEYGRDADAATRAAGNLVGRPWRSWDTAGRLTSGYDFHGNTSLSARQFLEEATDTADWSSLDETALSSEVLETWSEFDALGRPTLTRSPGPERDAPAVQAFGYDERGQLRSVAVSHRGGVPQPFVTHIAYDARGQRTAVRRANGVVTTYVYEPDTFRLAVLRSVREEEDGSRTTLQALTYTYDAVGNVAHKRDDAQEPVFFANARMVPEERYRYDALHRLVESSGREAVTPSVGPRDVAAWTPSTPETASHSAMRNYTEAFAYDAVGNLLQVHHFAGNVGTSPVWTRDYRIDGTSNRLVSTTEGGVASLYTHSVRGAMTSMPHLPVMERDFRDQLAHTTSGSGWEAHYRYDGGGQRVRRLVDKGHVREERVYVGQTEVFRRTDTQGRLLHERWSLWVSDGSGRIAVLDALGAADDGSGQTQDETRWQLTDHLGSGAVEVDADGRVISAEGFHAFGCTAWRSGRSEREVKSRRFRYTGKERDEETGLQVHGVRAYAVWLGRWASADPAGFVDGTNRYAYARNRPTRLVDPTGRSGNWVMDRLEAVGLREQAEAGLQAVSDTLAGTEASYKLPAMVAGGLDMMVANLAGIEAMSPTPVDHPMKYLASERLGALAADVTTYAESQRNAYVAGGGEVQPYDIETAKFLGAVTTLLGMAVGPELAIEGMATLGGRAVRGIQGVSAEVSGSRALGSDLGEAGMDRLRAAKDLAQPGAGASKAVVSETRGAVTNLGSRAVAENAELFGRLPAGEGMSGVFDHASGRFVLRHSTTASPLPEGSVARYGGHRAVRGDLAEALGDDLSSAASGRLSGFSVSKQADGSVRFGWNSGQINPGSHGTRAVPAELQAEIEASVRAALGL